jgi:CubicO group peptidase (beta-lactamase class C family)
VAYIQLVKQGVLKLGDSAQTESPYPKLKELKVLRLDSTLEQKNTAITGRILLTHTAGFGYSLFEKRH